MADFTKQRIETLTQEAAQAPTFQPDANPGIAAVNLVNTGLQAYRRSEARKQLETLQQQQADRETDIAEGILSLRQRRTELAAQGVTGVALEREERDLLSRYDARTRIEIIQGTNSLTKGSLSDTDKRAREVLTEQEEFNTKAMEAAGWVGVAPSEFNAMSEEDKKQLIARASYDRTMLNAKLQRHTLNAQEATTARNEKQAKVAGFLDAFRFTYGNAAMSRMKETMNNTNWADPAARGEAIRQLQEETLNIRPTVIQVAADQDVQLSREEIDSLVTEVDGYAKKVIARIQDKEVVDMNTAFVSNRMSALMHDMMKEGGVRGDLASTVMMSAGLGLRLSDQDFSAMMQEVVRAMGPGGLTENPQTATPNAGPQTNNTGIVGKVGNFITSLFDWSSEAQSRIQPKDRQTLTDLTVNSLTGTDAKVNAAIDRGVVKGFLSGFAKGTSVWDTSRNEEILRSLQDPTEKLLTRTLSAFLKETESIAPVGVGRSNSLTPVRGGVARGAGAYTLDEATGLVKPVDPQKTMSPRALAVNSLINDTIKAYEALGASEASIESIKAIVYNSMMQGE